MIFISPLSLAAGCNDGLSHICSRTEKWTCSRVRAPCRPRRRTAARLSSCSGAHDGPCPLADQHLARPQHSCHNTIVPHTQNARDARQPCTSARPAYASLMRHAVLRTAAHKARAERPGAVSRTPTKAPHRTLACTPDHNQIMKPLFVLMQRHFLRQRSATWRQPWRQGQARS